MGSPTSAFLVIAVRDLSATHYRFGVISVVIVVFLLMRMDDADEEKKRAASGIRMVRYIAWLIGQIISSSIHVSKLVWSNPKNEFS